jgi:hypothetical protein
LKIPFTKKRADGVAQGVGPEFKPQYWEKKKKSNLQDSTQENGYLPGVGMDF